MVAINQKGSALLTALFIMTLVAIVATAMSLRLQLDIYRTRMVLNHEKLYLASEAVTFWSLGELNNSKNTFKKLVNHGMVDVYPASMSSLVAGVHLSGGIYDMQARFNVDTIFENANFAIFANLIHQVLPDVTRQQSANLAFAAKDWISPYDPSRGKDTFSSYYLSKNPPYFPSHQFFRSVSELRLVQGFTAPIYTGIEPFITVLPEVTPVNIYTAPSQVLMSLSFTMTQKQVDKIIQTRQMPAVNDKDQMSELIAQLNLGAHLITQESHYFLTVANANSADFNLVVYTLIKRSKDKNNKWVSSIIRQSFSAF